MPITVPPFERVQDNDGDYVKVTEDKGVVCEWFGTNTPYDLGTTISGSLSVAFANGAVQTGTVTGNTTVSMTAPPNGGPAKVVIKLTQGGSGGYTISFSGITWVGSNTPSFPTTVGTKLVIVVFYDGTQYLATIGVVGQSSLIMEQDGVEAYVKPTVAGRGLRLYGSSSGNTAFTISSDGVLTLANESSNDADVGYGANLTIKETSFRGYSGIKFEAANGIPVVFLRAELTDGGSNTSGALTLFTRKNIAGGSGFVQSLHITKDQVIGLGNDATSAIGNQGVVNVYDTRTDKVPFNVRSPFGSTVDMFQVGYGGYYFRINKDGHICPGLDTNIYFVNGRAISWNTVSGTFNGSCYIYGDAVNNDFCIVAARKTLISGMSKGLALVNGSGNNLAIGSEDFESGMYNNIVMRGSSTPTTDVPYGGIHIYASQVGGNDWAPHFRCYGGNVIKLFKGLKANFNNFATLADVVSLLQSIGLAEI